jgi:(2Fe-2S) ferredoxin
LSDSDPKTVLQRKIDSVGVRRYKRHLLLCIGPKCVSEGQGKELWDHVKKRFAEKGLMNESAFRSKVGCLRVCTQGAIAVVYPEGTWYGSLDKTAIDTIIEEHVVGGKVVDKYKIAQADSLAQD